jgi:hypothetical protein
MPLMLFFLGLLLRLLLLKFPGSAALGMAQQAAAGFLSLGALVLLCAAVREANQYRNLGVAVSASIILGLWATANLFAVGTFAHLLTTRFQSLPGGRWGYLLCGPPALLDVSWFRVPLLALGEARLESRELRLVDQLSSSLALTALVYRDLPAVLALSASIFGAASVLSVLAFFCCLLALLLSALGEGLLWGARFLGRGVPRLPRGPRLPFREPLFPAPEGEDGGAVVLSASFMLKPPSGTDAALRRGLLLATFPILVLTLLPQLLLPFGAPLELRSLAHLAVPLLTSRAAVA